MVRKFDEMSPEEQMQAFAEYKKKKEAKQSTAPAKRRAVKRIVDKYKEEYEKIYQAELRKIKEGK